MTLFDAIAEALANSNPPPKTEADTCLRVIYPLIRACGYSALEIESEALDNNSQYPDYTILPASKDHTWYLEAKAWSMQLADKQAQQCMGYAYHNARKWVVLTNGQIWRLYDSQVHALAPERMVSEVRLENTHAMAAFLTALSKDAVLSGGLEKYAQASRLRRELAVQLGDENSEAVKALHKVLRARPGLASISRADVLRCITVGGCPHQQDSRQDGDARKSSTVVNDEPAEDVPEGPTLADLLRGGRAANDYLYPVEIVLPDGSKITPSSWKEAATRVVDWVGRNGNRPELPFRGLPSGDRYFINYEPRHPEYPMNSHSVVQWGDRSAYVHTGRAAFEYVKGLSALCEAAGIAVSGIRLKMKPWGKAAKAASESEAE